MSLVTYSGSGPAETHSSDDLGRDTQDTPRHAAPPSPQDSHAENEQRRTHDDSTALQQGQGAMDTDRLSGEKRQHSPAADTPNQVRRLHHQVGGCGSEGPQQALVPGGESSEQPMERALIPIHPNPPGDLSVCLSRLVVLKSNLQLVQGELREVKQDL